MSSLLKFVVIVQFSLVISACTVHKLDVQQGNVITKDMVERLKDGMTKRQVRFVMGTPLIEDLFHAQRWDYVYLSHPGDKSTADAWRRVTIFFEKDQLTQVVSDIDG